MKNLTAIFYLLCGLFVIYGALFGWYKLGDFSRDTAFIVGFVLFGVSSILVFMPRR